MDDTIIRTENLHHSYAASEDELEIEVLHGIDLHVKQGSFVGSWATGSGKSTLAKHFNAVLLPDVGKVWVSGMDTSSEENTLDIRRTVGMVFQNPDNQIVANVVEEDVAFAPRISDIPPRRYGKGSTMPSRPSTCTICAPTRRTCSPEGRSSA